jgi:hypothetical protein
MKWFKISCLRHTTGIIKPTIQKFHFFGTSAIAWNRTTVVEFITFVTKTFDHIPTYKRWECFSTISQKRTIAVYDDLSPGSGGYCTVTLRPCYENSHIVRILSTSIAISFYFLSDTVTYSWGLQSRCYENL